MDREPGTDSRTNSTNEEPLSSKRCSRCGEQKPLSEFLRRTGRRAGKTGRRGTCRDCRRSAKIAPSAAAPEDEAGATAARAGEGGETAAAGESAASAAEPAGPTGRKARRKKKRKAAAVGAGAAGEVQAGAAQAGAAQTGAAQTGAANAGAMHAGAALPQPRIRRPLPALPALPPRPEGPEAAVLKPTRSGIIRMRGRTDKGRRWQQETDLETAVTLVRERAAVVVNRHTIRRLYSNKAFRRYILTRDRYTCFYCGGYGDTIDHLLPRAKGGHTTPANCVCACHLCNQSKADLSLDEFVQTIDNPEL